MTTRLGLYLQLFERPYVGPKLKVVSAPKKAAGFWQVVALDGGGALFSSTLHECNLAAKSLEKYIPDKEV